MTTERRPLHDWEKDECSALKAEIKAHNARLPKDKRLTQEDIALSLGMSQGTLGSHLNGSRAISQKLAVGMASLLGIPVENFSKRIAQEIREISSVAAAASSNSTSAAEKVMEMIRKHAGNNLDAEAQQKIADAVAEGLAAAPAPPAKAATDLGRRPGELVIRQYDVRASMGHGQIPPDYKEVVRNLVISEEVLREKGVTYTSAHSLAMITGWGQSMEGTINDKDPVIVDRGVNEFIGDGVYVITWHDMLYIKRLQVLDAERFWLISDNEKHKDIEARIEDVTIHAKVLLIWNARKA